MTASRLVIIIVCSVLAGLGVGIGGTFIVVNARDREIAELTAVLNDMRQHFATQDARQQEEERKLRAFNRVDDPPRFAKPQTFQGGFQ